MKTDKELHDKLDVVISDSSSKDSAEINKKIKDIITDHLDANRHEKQYDKAMEVLQKLEK